MKFSIIHKIDYIVVYFKRGNENKYRFWTEIAS